MSIDFESKPIYGDTYIHTYIHIQFIVFFP